METACIVTSFVSLILAVDFFNIPFGLAKVSSYGRK
jgi:hypothetical protein